MGGWRCRWTGWCCGRCRRGAGGGAGGRITRRCSRWTGCRSPCRPGPGWRGGGRCWVRTAARWLAAAGVAWRLVARYAGLAELAAAVDAGGAVPAWWWRCLPAATGGGPDRDGGGDAGGVVRVAVGWVLGLVQGWLAEERFGVVAAGGGDPGRGRAGGPGEDSGGGSGRGGGVGPGAAAQAEHPGRFVLADVDDSPASAAGCWPAAAGCGEPEVAVRDGAVFARRLGRRCPADAWPGGRDRTVAAGGAAGRDAGRAGAGGRPAGGRAAGAGAGAGGGAGGGAELPGRADRAGHVPGAAVARQRGRRGGGGDRPGGGRAWRPGTGCWG